MRPRPKPRARRAANARADFAAQNRRCAALILRTSVGGDDDSLAIRWAREVIPAERAESLLSSRDSSVEVDHPC